MRAPGPQATAKYHTTTSISSCESLMSDTTTSTTEGDPVAVLSATNS